MNASLNSGNQFYRTFGIKPLAEAGITLSTELMSSRAAAKAAAKDRTKA